MYNNCYSLARVWAACGYYYTKRCRFLNIFAKLQSKIQENRQDIYNEFFDIVISKV